MTLEAIRVLRLEQLKLEQSIVEGRKRLSQVKNEISQAELDCQHDYKVHVGTVFKIQVCTKCHKVLMEKNEN